VIREPLDSVENSVMEVLWKGLEGVVDQASQCRGLARRRGLLLRANVGRRCLIHADAAYNGVMIYIMATMNNVTVHWHLDKS